MKKGADGLNWAVNPEIRRSGKLIPMGRGVIRPAPRRYLSQEECRTLLDACPTAIMRSVVMLALNTGMRRGEILHLKWKDINLREGYLEIVEQKNGKTSTIPLNSTAMETLRSIPRRLADYVFTGLIPGEPFYDLRRQFEKAVTKAGLTDVNFHTLRHSCASHLVMSGAELATVREILRHKDYKTTLRYSHLSKDHKRAAMEALGNSLAAKSGKGEKVS
jgi:integrase